MNLSTNTSNLAVSFSSMMEASTSCTKYWMHFSSKLSS